MSMAYGLDITHTLHMSVLSVEQGKSVIRSVETRNIIRLNSVKNTNFGLDNKKSFLMHPKIVFGVTDHFSIK